MTNLLEKIKEACGMPGTAIIDTITVLIKGFEIYWINEGESFKTRFDSHKTGIDGVFTILSEELNNLGEAVNEVIVANHPEKRVDDLVVGTVLYDSMTGFSFVLD